MRSTAAEDGVIENITRARRPHDGNFGAFVRQKSWIFRVVCHVATVELDVADPLRGGEQVGAQGPVRKGQSEARKGQ